MAKRFGRNQRRQMREEIAKAQRAHEYATNRYRDAERERARLEERLARWATEILHLLGRDSAFNEQLTRYRTAGHMPTLKLLPIRNAPVAPLPGDVPRYERISDVIEACIMRCRIKSNDLERMIAVEIGDHMGTLVAYGVPEERRRKWSPRDIEMIGQLIANEMAQHLAADNQRKRA